MRNELSVYDFIQFALFIAIVELVVFYALKVLE